jgi:hypothetical protein
MTALPTHRLYRQIDQPLHLMGVEPEDIFVLAGAFVLCSRLARIVAVAVGVVRLQFLLALAASALLFYLWRRYRTGRPRYFFRHALAYLSEPDTYRTTADDEVIPHVL